MSGKSCQLLIKQLIRNSNFDLTKQHFMSYEDFCFEDSRCEDFCYVHPVVWSLVGSIIAASIPPSLKME